MKNLLCSLLLIFTVQWSYAAHIVGGEVYYDSLGNDQYRVVFEIYRDCQGAGAAFDNPLNYTVFYANGTIFNQFSVTLASVDQLPIVYDDPCVTPPNDICIERGIYEQVITLPATVDGYYIVYQRCCWTAAIQNIVNPGDWGITIRTDVPGTGLVAAEDNNSARFSNYPPIVLCSGNTLQFDHVAEDPDADSLVYFMCAPETVHLDDQIVGNPIYDPELPEPYQLVTWEPGFTAVQPLGTGSNITIDSQTGVMSITPNQIGMYVASVCVQEYREGILINEKSRTFGYRVVACEQETPMQVDVIGNAELIENCAAAGFVVTRDNADEDVDFQVFVSGSATNGVDYNSIPSVLTMPAGVFTDTIVISPTGDNLTEGDEYVIFSIVVENVCEGTFDTTTAYITILDYVFMSITHTDSINVCDETGETGMLWCSVSNGVPPYYYDWNYIAGVNNDTLVFPSPGLEPNLNLMYVWVWDACGVKIESEPIRVYNQCPLGPPNVITANGDSVNDFFIIKNVEDYDQVHLTVFNRWGNVVLDDTDYQNDWTGKDLNGNPLEEGVYTYVVTPVSVKYIYDDQEKTKYTAHGFLHIIRDK